ncbi:MAG: hypothetical protein H8E46_10825 [FCB group bacterium]|nr:hypothetical protein [FCB group bacterium]
MNGRSRSVHHRDEEALGKAILTRMGRVFRIHSELSNEVMLGGVQSRKGNYSQRIEQIKRIVRGDSLAIMAIKAIPMWRRVPALCADNAVILNHVPDLIRY